MRHEIVSWPVGMHALPEAGGLLDQPADVMELFSYFLDGERLAALKRIQR